MLYFFKNNDEIGDLISEKLADISAAHKVFQIDEGESYLSEYENDFKGRKHILHFLANYSNLLYNQRLVGADACYIDPDTGNEACII